ncbi:hypothetical protein ACS0TY_025146 [Phlomoides rotata]
MSYSSISTFFLIVALLYATANPLAHATVPVRVAITGRLCCTANGNCLTTSVGVAGAPVSLRCPVGFSLTPTVVATATTDAAGTFSLTSVTQVNLPSLCDVIVQLPVTGAAAISCPLLAAVPPRTLTTRVTITNNGIFTGIATGVARPFA